MAQLQRLHNLMRGLPPPPESLSSLQATSAAAAAAASSSSSDASSASHQCSACGKGIRNDLRRQLAGSNEIGGFGAG